MNQVIFNFSLVGLIVYSTWLVCLIAFGSTPRNYELEEQYRDQRTTVSWSILQSILMLYGVKPKRQTAAKTPLLKRELLVAMTMLSGFRQRVKKFVKPETVEESSIKSLIILVPAMNEEPVIKKTIAGFLESTRHLPMVKMVIIDDGSTDETANEVRQAISQYACTDRVQLIQRFKPNAQTGKGDALNWAYHRVVDQETDPSRVVCGVLDADAYMRPIDYERVIKTFSQSPKLALLQTRVKMVECHNLLQILQDVEFTVINNWIQNTRNKINNAAASGNGQFIRASLVTRYDPWGNALLEDFEFSTRFLLEGKETRYAPDIVVYQEAVDKVKAFVRQRTRWTQGGMDCLTGYWGRILRNNHVGGLAKLEMSFYMLIPFTTILFGIANLYVLGYVIANLSQYWLLLIGLLMINYSIDLLICYNYLKISQEEQTPQIYFACILLILYNYILYPAIIIALCNKLRGITKWEKTTHGIQDQIGN